MLAEDAPTRNVPALLLDKTSFKIT